MEMSVENGMRKRKIDEWQRKWGGGWIPSCVCGAPGPLREDMIGD